MTYWTVLWINILSGPLDGSNSGLIYPSLESCEAAINTVVSTFSGAYDYNVTCEETTQLSSSIRPKPRPEGLGE